MVSPVYKKENIMAVVTIWRRVKIDGKYPFLAASIAPNGRLEPFVAEYNRRWKTFQGGTYYLRYAEDGKRCFEQVGNDPAVADSSH
jgi:hypothetical protein